MVQQTPLSLSVSRVHIWNVNGVVATTFGWGEMRCEVRSKAFMKVSQDGNEFCVSIMETGANCKPLELNGVFKAMLMITLRINKIFCLQFIHFILLYFILWGMIVTRVCRWFKDAPGIGDFLAIPAVHLASQVHIKWRIEQNIKTFAIYMLWTFTQLVTWVWRARRQQ